MAIQILHSIKLTTSRLVVRVETMYLIILNEYSYSIFRSKAGSSIYKPVISESSLFLSKLKLQIPLPHIYVRTFVFPNQFLSHKNNRCSMLSRLSFISKSCTLPSVNKPLARMSVSTTTKHSITTAACLIIGDEVLNGKIKDTNSTYFSRFCFARGIEVKHIAVVPDEEFDIVETIQRLASRYDFIVTSGGIGPTHDDITYEAIGKAFGLGVEIDEGIATRMRKLGKSKIDPNNKEAVAAQLRMATIPKGPNVEPIYIADDLWVPVVTIDNKIHILPGVPQLFTRMLDGLHPYIESRLPADDRKLIRFYVSTKLKESEMAPYLTRKQAEVDFKGVKLGSYPHMSVGINTVSIIGREADKEYLREIVKDVESNLSGQEVSKEDEEKNSAS